MTGICCGPPPIPDAIWASWNLDPALILVLMLVAAVTGREASGKAAVAVLALAFVSPLCALSSALFSARALHHVLLVAVAAPLLALALSRRLGRAPERAAAMSAGLAALPLAVATAVLWLWHLPAAYDAALANKAVYWVMQLTLLASALWFWRVVLASSPEPIAAIVLITANFAQMGLLGALLTFAPLPLYEAHAVAPHAWGLTPLGDQQLAGLIMWVPTAVPYAIAAIAVGRRGWAELERSTA